MNTFIFLLSCIFFPPMKRPFIYLKLTLSALLAIHLNACQTLTAQNNTSADSTFLTHTDFTLNQNTQKHTLDNGLTVIIKEDHRAPIVMTQVWYDVGSNKEPIGKGGLSHFLEHLMFKDTPKVSGDEFSQLISYYGGNNNAYTNQDVTVYHEILPANRFEMALELEANRMKNIIFDDDKIQSERNVILEERQSRTDSNPNTRAFEKILAFLYDKNPRANPVIGSRQDILNLNKRDLQNWYQRWYAPNNATVVIVGDVDTNEALLAVKRYFGQIKHQTIDKTKPDLTLTAPSTPKHLDIYEEVTVPNIVLAWQVPTLKSPNNAQDSYALSLLADVFDGGMSARFENNLIRKGKYINSIGVSYDDLQYGDGYFIISATPKDGVNPDMVKTAILHEIHNILTGDIHDDELTRLPIAIKVSDVMEADNIASQAQTLGRLHYLDLPFHQNQIRLEKIGKLTANDIKMVGKKYLNEQKLYSIYILPNSVKPANRP